MGTLLYTSIYFALSLFVNIGQCCSPCWVKDQAHKAIYHGSGSAKRCGEGQLFHPESDTCHNYDPYSFHRGPCGANMILKATKNPKVGKCICEDSIHPLVYIPRSNRCDKIFTQGPCPPGKWLYFNNGSVKCAPNPCQGVTGDEGTVFLNGECVFLGHICLSSAGGDGMVAFNEAFVPVCKVVPKISPFAIGAIGSANCASNLYRTPDGRSCQEPIFFDFD